LVRRLSGQGYQDEIGNRKDEMDRFLCSCLSSHGDSGRWYAVEDIDGDIFWIHRSLITEQYRCGAVSSAKVNVRTGPGVHFGKVFLEPAEKFYSFRVLQRKGAWIKVRDMDNNTGWVRRDYCRIR
jgi:SH3-like domain-containing protein